MTAPSSRGLVLPLTLEQVAVRATFLGDLSCIDGYYQLQGHNGGKDPAADDPFDRWPFFDRDGKQLEARTADCIGGAAWCGGFDRYQPVRFAHLYDGWINTDSMLMDASGPRKCFVTLDAPERGCFVVAPTGAPGFERCGHIGTVIRVPTVWKANDVDCWRSLLLTDVASRGPARANTTHDATWWFAGRDHGVRFVKSIMKP